MPSEVDVTLPYSNYFNLTSPATLVATKYLNSNGAYDVDPLLASTATQGFAEWAAFYTYYRVIGYTYDIEVNNANNIPVIFTILNSNTSLGLSTGIGTSVDLYPYSNNPLAQSKLLSHAYNTHGYHRFKKSLTILEVVGSAAPETEDNYRGTAAANPVDLTYICMGVTSPEGGTNYPSNIVSAVVRLQLHIRFYDRKQLTT
jgi:hypothetical protein